MVHSSMNFTIYFFVLGQLSLLDAKPSNLTNKINTKTYTYKNYELTHPLREHTKLTNQQQIIKIENAEADNVESTNDTYKEYKQRNEYNNSNSVQSDTNLFDFLILNSEPKEEQWYRMRSPTTNEATIPIKLKQPIEVSEQNDELIENILEWLHKRDMQELEAIYRDLGQGELLVDNDRSSSVKTFNGKPCEVEPEKQIQTKNEDALSNQQQEDNNSNIVTRTISKSDDSDKVSPINNDFIISSNTHLDNELVENLMSVVGNLHL